MERKIEGFDGKGIEKWKGKKEMTVITCVTSSECASKTARGHVCFADFLTSQRVTTVSNDAMSSGEEWVGVSQQLNALRPSVSVK
jgi:hypothetical protein